MIRGIYTGATGMMSQQRRLDVISNNLANVNTSGFKRDYLTNESLPEKPMYRVALGGAAFIGTLGYGTDTPVVRTNHSAGTMQVTGNPLDLALDGQGFFALETPRGERYTRNGNFHRDGEGYLVTSAGDYVLGQKGLINLGSGAVTIDEDGRVSVDGRKVDQLRVVSLPESGSRKEGETYWLAAQTEDSPGVAVRQGAIERSNVNPVQEMVNMITVLRAYEANQKVITTQDQLLGKAVTEVGQT